MLFDLVRLYEEYDLKKSGVIHVGAHWGTEFESYNLLDLEHKIFFEPTPSSFAKLSENLIDENVTLVNKAVGNQNQMIEMFVETKNKGQSNSILKPTRHLVDYPNITFDGTQMVEMVRLDDYLDNGEKYNLLNMDVQGYELEVLKGATNQLGNIDAIISEVSFDHLYEGSVLIEELDEFLSDYDFVRAKTQWWKKSCWGDAFYVRKSRKSL